MKIIKLRAVFVVMFLVFSISSSIGLTVSNENTSSGTFDIPYQEGWPQETTGKIDSSPVIADLDNDGMMEIIVGSGGAFDSTFKAYVFNYDGSIKNGWPVSLVGNEIVGSPAIGDLDSDGDLEIVLGDCDSFVYAWHHDGIIVDGWPKPIDFLTSSPTLYDMDGDGDLEIIVGSNKHVENNTRSFAEVSIWHHDGTNMNGWPQMITNFHSSYVRSSSPALGDIDNDGDAEIIVGIRTSSVDEKEGFVYAWHQNGQLVDGWPVSAGKPNDVCSSPILGDLDDDNDLEIIIGTDKGIIFALNHDGSNVSGWPNYCYSSIGGQAMADIDQDGKFEVMNCVKARKVYVWNDNGNLLDGWPQPTGGHIYNPPIAGDIAGDEHLELISPCMDNKVYAWFHNGTVVPGFPLETGDGIYSTLCLGDIDSDGDVELIVGSTDKKLYVWDLPHPYKKDLMEWPMYQHDLYHTGEFSFGRGFVADANGPYYNRIDNENVFIGSILNGGPPFEWHWDFGDGNSSNEQNPTHVYDKVGNYIVNLTAIDSMGIRTYDEDMVYISLFGRDENGALRISSIKGGFGVTAVIENVGTVDAEGVEWTIEIDDNYYKDECLVSSPKDGKKTGVIDIPAGESRSIWCFVYRKLGVPFWPSYYIEFYISVSAKIIDCIASDSVDKYITLFFAYD